MIELFSTLEKNRVILIEAAQQQLVEALPELESFEEGEGDWFIEHMFESLGDYIVTQEIDTISSVSRYLVKFFTSKHLSYEKALCVPFSLIKVIQEFTNSQQIGAEDRLGPETLEKGIEMLDYLQEEFPLLFYFYSLDIINKRQRTFDLQLIQDLFTLLNLSKIDILSKLKSIFLDQRPEFKTLEEIELESLLEKIYDAYIWFLVTGIIKPFDQFFDEFIPKMFQHARYPHIIDSVMIIGSIVRPLILRKDDSVIKANQVFLLTENLSYDIISRFLQKSRVYFLTTDIPQQKSEKK